MTAAEPELSEDTILGGRVRLLQPRQGYRAGVDPVLLAAAAPVAPGARVLDLGCGVGTVALCLAARVPGLRLSGVDLLAENIALARRNAALNGVDIAFSMGDVSCLPAELRRQSFDHVLTNPPYLLPRAGPGSRVPHRDRAMGETIPLALWIDAALKRLAPRGRLSVIMRADRLPELLSAIGERLGDVRVLPLVARAGQPATRVLLSGQKDRRAPFRLLSPLILHAGDRHLSDAEDYTPEVAAILRHAAPLSLEIQDGKGARMTGM